MIDLILASALLGFFYLGFKAGNRFKSFSDMVRTGVEKMTK